MVKLVINEAEHVLDVEPETPLLYVLRDELGLNAAKYGCGLGQCGACTVIVDGEPILSCVAPAVLLEGKRITTLEGLGTHEKPGVLQQAFIDEQAAQCGRLVLRTEDAARLQLGHQPARDAAQVGREAAGAEPEAGEPGRLPLDQQIGELGRRTGEDGGVG